MSKTEQQHALEHLTAELKWETVINERAKAKGGGSRRGSTGGIGAVRAVYGNLSRVFTHPHVLGLLTRPR